MRSEGKMWKPTIEEVERLYEKHAKQLETSHLGRRILDRLSRYL